MIIESKAPGFPKAELFPNTVGEFIDGSFREWAFYWGEDVSTDSLVQAWVDLIEIKYTTIEGVTFEVIA